MNDKNYLHQIYQLATMVDSTDHFAKRLSEESGLPFDVVMDDMNEVLDK